MCRKSGGMIMGTELSRNSIVIEDGQEIDFIDVTYVGYNRESGIHEFVCVENVVYAITDSDLKYDGELVEGDWVCLYENSGNELGYGMVPF